MEVDGTFKGGKITDIKYLSSRYNNTPEDAVALAKMRVQLSDLPNMFLDPSYWNTNCFGLVLERLDRKKDFTDENDLTDPSEPEPTRGKITCIPFNHLKQKIYSSENNKKNEELKAVLKKMFENNEPRLKIKDFMFRESVLKEKNENSLIKKSEIQKYYKPFLRSKLTKHPKYHNRVRSKFELNRAPNPKNNFLYEYEEEPRDEWLSNRNIAEFCKKLIYVYDNCCFLLPLRSNTFNVNHMLVFPKRRRYTSDEFETERVKKSMGLLGNEIYNHRNTRYMYVPVIYNEHFTVFLYDSVNHYLYYFNSAGCRRPPTVDGVDTWIINNSGSTKKAPEDIEHPDILVRCVAEEFNNFKKRVVGESDKPVRMCLFVNDFMIQESGSECGMFVLLFCMINCSSPPKDRADYSKNLDTIFQCMGDYFVGLSRSLFFVSSEDMDYDEYINNHNTVPVTNDKFAHFCEEMDESQRVLERTLSKLYVF